MKTGVVDSMGPKPTGGKTTPRKGESPRGKPDSPDKKKASPSKGLTKVGGTMAKFGSMSSLGGGAAPKNPEKDAAMVELKTCYEDCKKLAQKEPPAAQNAEHRAGPGVG